MVEIKTQGLLEKVQERLKACQAYAKSDERESRQERLYRKLKGLYHKGSEPKNAVKVEGIAAYTYQTRPTFHFRRPSISVSAKTPKFVTSIGEEEKSLNNTRNAMIMELALNQEYKEIEIEDEVNAMIQDAICPYDFAGLKVGYSYMTQFSQVEEAEKVVEDRIWGMRVCPEDIFIDWQSTGKKSLRYYFHRIWKPVQWAKDHKDFSKKGREQVTAASIPDFLKNRYGQTENQSGFDMAALYEYHDLEENQIGLFCFGASDWLLDPYNFPYKFRGGQFVFFVPYPLNNDFYGRCGAHMIEPQVDETNTFRNRVSSVIKKFPMVNFYQKGAWSIEQQRKWKDAEDAENIEVTDLNGIRTQLIPPVSADAWRYQEVIERDQEKVSGSSAMRRGQVTAVKPTTAQIIEGHGNLRDADIREEVAKIYRRTAQKHADLMIQYYTRPKWVRITGGMTVPKDVQLEMTDQGPFLLYTNQDIAGNYDFDIDVQSLVPINKEVQAKVLMETLAGVSKMPPYVQEQFFSTYNVPEIISEVVKMQGVDLNKYKNEEEPAGQTDPTLEDEHVLKGGILEHPAEGEPDEQHASVHAATVRALGGNPDDPNPSPDPRINEIKRHYRIHVARIMRKQTMTPMPQEMGEVQLGQMGGMPGAVPPRPVLPPTTPPLPRRAGIAAQIRDILK